MSERMELGTWQGFKDTCVTAKSLRCQFSEGSDRYDLFGPEDPFLWHTSILKTDPASSDQTDFETNFKASWNKPVVQLDSDGASMSRVKVAPSGWNFQFRGTEFSTSTIGSVVNKDAMNADLSDATLKLYAADGTLITDQTTATTSCVKSVIDIEPPYDYYITGGKMRLISAPTTDARVAVIGVPDVPAQYGGSKAFVQNVNLKFIPVTEGVNADGRAAKWLQYSVSNHTNKLRFIIYHDAGIVIPTAIFLELYKL